MSVKQCLVVSVSLGLVLGLSAYLFLCAVGRQLERDMVVDDSIPMSYFSLIGSPGLSFDSSCGLDNPAVCEALDATPKLETVKDTANELHVQQAASTSLQPYGLSVEDEYTASEAVFKTGYYNPQTTQNYLLIEDASAHLQ